MNKSIIYSAFILFSINTLSQELDENYLDSLPIGVKEDVLEQMEAQEDVEKPVYRKASTMLNKEGAEIYTMKKDGYVIEVDAKAANKMKRQGWKLIAKEEPRGIFGEEIFDMFQSTFMPINEPNLDGSYILDFGDILEIQIIGQKNKLEELPVRRDGSINIDDIGRIALSGLSLAEASKVIKTRVENTLIGSEAYVTLTNVRDIQVIVSGNAYNPGIYTLSGNSNVLHAITMAGGVSKNGSYREINLIRNNNVIDSIDLYDLFIYGKSNFNKRLRTGDSILVSPTKKIVNVLSGVKRPLLYEMKENETFKDVINFANGISSNADLETIQLQRLDKDSIKITSLNYQDIDKIIVADNDALLIKEYKYGDVNISGAVKIPGKYKIGNGDTLRDLIVRAGGYDDHAYPFGGFLNNQRSEQINSDARDKLYKQFIKNLIDNASATTSNNNETLPLILEELRNTADVGRVIAEFDIDVLELRPELDTILEDGDSIIIPLATQQVYIYGEVSNQGAIRYSPGRDPEYYIRNSGGLLSSADNETIYIVHPNGQTENINDNNKFSRLAFNNEEGIKVYPGSIIYIPRSSDIINPTQAAALWSPIISSIALTIASVSSLNNN